MTSKITAPHHLSKYTFDRAKAISRDLANGLPIPIAAPANGVSPATLYDWLRKGQDGTEPYVELYRMVATSRKRHVKKLLGRLEKASVDGDVKATQWVLEKSYPDLFGRESVQSPQSTPQITATKAREIIEAFIVSSDEAPALPEGGGDHGGDGEIE